MVTSKSKSQYFAKKIILSLIFFFWTQTFPAHALFLGYFDAPARNLNFSCGQVLVLISSAMSSVKPVTGDESVQSLIVRSSELDLQINFASKLLQPIDMNFIRLQDRPTLRHYFGNYLFDFERKESMPLSRILKPRAMEIISRLVSLNKKTEQLLALTQNILQIGVDHSDDRLMLKNFPTTSFSGLLNGANYWLPFATGHYGSLSVPLDTPDPIPTWTSAFADKDIPVVTRNGLSFFIRILKKLRLDPGVDSSERAHILKEVKFYISDAVAEIEAYKRLIPNSEENPRASANHQSPLP